MLRERPTIYRRTRKPFIGRQRVPNTCEINWISLATNMNRVYAGNMIYTELTCANTKQVQQIHASDERSNTTTFVTVSSTTTTTKRLELQQNITAQLSNVADISTPPQTSPALLLLQPPAPVVKRQCQDTRSKLLFMMLRNF